MLTAYLDESFQTGDGYVVMAGFLGNQRSWSQLTSEWKIALHPKTALHMNKLRWPKGRDRHKLMLEKLGAVPRGCGLRPVFASVRIADYRSQLKRPDGVLSNGYFVTLVALTQAMLKSLPKGERLKLVVETQVEYAQAREAAISVLQKEPEYRYRGRPMLTGCESSQKCTLLEPSDYLAYAILQWLIDKDSIRARNCAPILRGEKRLGGMLSAREVKRILTFKKGVPI
ncbi:MAG: hypothetical protein P4L87_21730 [Formivibrio sp.]|nr:hypothetical protein [Formivibrio sp.]